jgi:hypothetical protein
MQAQRRLEKGLARHARAVVPVSAVTRDGIEDLWSLIRAAVNGGGHEVTHDGH